MPVAAKPKSRNKPETGFDDKKALDFIRQGGSQSQDEKPAPQIQHVNGSKGRHTTKTDPNDQVSISIKLLVSERNHINESRAKRSGREKISLEGWIIEAVNEKLQREDKRRNQV